ncbi:hypothetical protein GCM10022198_08640 [Klugiella xanthotipulae]|uniref:Uncharacterized protein n=1 Tax=Klugiella xanthotipulae TaxID=244735 RepID=A0A543I3Q2_9MICO|nr:hypothetical protein [Klugiella xanthotipulae]TQM65222.1 hypothetical protein FB466_0012 [Klugiella xanthotipulae]
MNNTNEINELIQMRVDDATSIAAQLLEKIAEHDEWHNVLDTGLKKHGKAFTAFLLVPQATARNVEDIVELFQRAFVLADYRNEHYAREALLAELGWERARETANRELGDLGLLTWDEAELQGAIADRYTFISTYDGCYVFDRHVLIPENER